MSEDEFSRATTKTLKEFAVGATEIIEGAAGAVVGPIVENTFTFFDALAERNNEAIAEFRLNAVEDELIKFRAELEALKAELAKEGKKPDRQDPLSQAAVASEFVQAVSEARTAEKREAIIHATARQFDPRLGVASARAYLLRRLREMPEIELTLVLLLTRHGEIGLLRGSFVACDRLGVGDGVTPLDLAQETFVALLAAAELASAGATASLIAKSAPGRTFKIEGQPTSLVRYGLTPLGTALAALAQP